MSAAPHACDPLLTADCQQMLVRLERAGVRAVHELSPEAARRQGMKLFDLDRRQGEMRLLRQLLRQRGLSASELASACGFSLEEVEQHLEQMLASGTVLRAERQKGTVTWSTRLSLRRRTLKHPDLLRKLEPEEGPAAVLRPRETLLSRELTLTGGLRARLYLPPSATGEPLPVVLFAHGGGWVTGSVDTHDSLCRTLCQGSGWAFLSVDYRLAPEHPWPAAPDDMASALHWLHEHGAKLGVNPERLALMGDSAGGNLALVSALQARAAGWPLPLLLVLICPTVDPSMACPSWRELADAPFLSAADMRWYYGHYAPDPDDWRAAPLRGDLRGLPPTLVISAMHDILRDEALLLGQRLEQEGGTVWQRPVPGVFHDFVLFGQAIAAAHQEQEEIGRLLRETAAASA
ncbi:alpha/beta hydrolase [Cyanobium sp. FACHB-13342]|uniref:alpha/beta hydrolase fold domain-containing protein n=1 Tax=Cyanobium sp. FACHB-13342 TaxID=2692793 RepID=UPI00167FF03F|nr:alpha/beta hydrolase [Cyanobium sp. FACHB-13342]